MKKMVNCRGKLLDFSAPKVMGILNVTPDSFYDGGIFTNDHAVFNHTRQMIDDGAAIVDIGAQSTRPRATLISADEEWERLEPVLKFVRAEFPDAVFSVDTFYSEVARKSADAGADIINDISGGSFDPEMFKTIAALKIPYVLMHIQGTPQTMQQHSEYENVVKEVMDYFADRIKTLISLGIPDIIIDPGFGFGKNGEHNYALLSHLELFKFFERPLCVGLSRKSMINKVIDTTPENALNGTTVLNTLALLKGASILRVHDVREAVEAITLVQKSRDE